MTSPDGGGSIHCAGAANKPLMRRTIPLMLGILLTLVSIYYLVRISLANVRDAGGLSALLDFDPLLLIASMIVLQIHFVSAAWSWKRACAVSGGRISTRSAYSIQFISLLGKYIPGKVWAAVGKVGLSRHAGVSIQSAGRALVLETLFIVICSLIMALPLTPTISNRLGMDPVLFTAALGLLIVTLLLTAHPGTHRRFTRLIRKVAGRDLSCVDPGFSNILKLIPVYLTVYLLQGMAFHLLALSFGVHLDFLPGIALFPTSVGVGFLMLLAPAGIGVSEVALLWLMRLIVPTSEQGALPLLALASRLWLTVSEIIAFATAVFLRGGWRAVREAMSSVRERGGEAGERPDSAGVSADCDPLDEDVR